MSDEANAGDRTYELSLHQMTEYTGALRKLGAGAETMEQVAQKVVEYLYDSLTDPETGENLCGLVRVFKTHPFGDLDDGLQRWALDLTGASEAPPDMKCLTLLATRGEATPWNSRHESQGHKAIPFIDEAMVEGIPMIAQLLRQLGLEIKTVLNPDRDFLLNAEEHTFNVFHVADALGSPFIPAQDEFVRPHKIKSVLGYGGILPSGDLFVVIIFWKRAISRETADMFQPLALSTKVALLPFLNKPIFGEN